MAMFNSYVSLPEGKSQQNPSVLIVNSSQPQGSLACCWAPKKKILLLNSNSNCNVYTKLNIYVYGLTPLYSPWNPRNNHPNFWSRVKATIGDPTLEILPLLSASTSSKKALVFTWTFLWPGITDTRCHQQNVNLLGIEWKKSAKHGGIQCIFFL